MKTAIIGTGIAGLGCAHYLHRDSDLTLFEQNDYSGGHTNTVSVQEEGGEVAIDTGFMVYNEVTYPNLTRLFNTLEVETKPTSMSFSVQHLPTGLEYCGSSLNHLFGQLKNLFSPKFFAFLYQINRFNKEAIAALSDPRFGTQTVREYVQNRGYGDDFLHRYLVPMSSAVWSTPPDQMLDFPVTTLLRFFHNHGFLGLHTQHPWRTVVNGARSYVEKITRPFKNRIQLRDSVVSVTREREGVRVATRSGKSELFDRVILACHADQSLALIQNPTPKERRLLGAFQYQFNLATLHMDERVMPKTRKCWSSWNYRVARRDDGAEVPSTIYWMNELQHVSKTRNYFVSVNGEEFIDESKVLKEIQYHHPLFSLKAIEAQKELPGLNRENSDIFFCGSYFRYGFHEDALTSALELSQLLLSKETRLATA